MSAHPHRSTDPKTKKVKVCRSPGCSECREPAVFLGEEERSRERSAKTSGASFSDIGVQVYKDLEMTPPTKDTLYST